MERVVVLRADMTGTEWGRRAALLLVLGGAVGLWGLASGGCDREPTPAASAAASASAVPGHLSPELASQVLAKVGDRTITLGDYAAVLDRMDQFERLRYQSPERRRQLLDEIVRVELLATEARRRGLDRDPKTVERIRQVLRDEVLKRLRMKQPGPEAIPEAEVRAYYEQHREEFFEPERRRVAHIELRDRKLAQQVLEEALKASPKEWGQLVQRHSLDHPDQASGPQPAELAGDLGIVSREGERGDNARVPEPLRAAVFEIQEVGGVYGKVVSAGKRFHVVRLTGKTDARQRDYADAERSIRVSLGQQRIRAAEAKLEAELRGRFPVEVDEAALAKVKVPTPEKRGAPSGATGKAKP
jgi:peptidyl-prolyl cis-trans isomerase C